LRGVLATAAVAAGDFARRQRLAGLVLDLHLAADDAAVAGDGDGHRSALAALLGIADEDGGFLAFVVEDHVENAVAVEIDEAHRLGVEDALVQADLLGAVFEGAVAFAPEETVRLLETADDEIEVAVVVHIAPGGAWGPAGEFGQVAGLGGDVGEAALAVAPIELAAAFLRDEKIEMSVVVEVGEDGPDLARCIGDAGILDELEARLAAFLHVEEQHALAGAVEHVGPAVAVDVGHSQRVALDALAESIRAKADLGRDINELFVLRHRQFADAGLEIERPIAVALADLEQQIVLALLQLENELVLIRCAGAIGRVGENLLTVEPDRKRVVAAE